MFNQNLLAMLACPVCQGELLWDATTEELVCRVDRLAYPVIDNIPVMLENRARRIE